MTAAIFGVAAFVWSGWAQERPPAGWVSRAALAVWANVAGRGDLIAPLILAVVGIHFLPLAAAFGQPIMAWAGGALTVVAVVAAVVPASGTARSFWCGIVGAPIFLIAGGVCLVAGIAELRA